MDASGTLTASVWQHNSAPETPTCLVRKIFNHLLLDVPFLLHNYGKLLGICMYLIFDVKHCSIHLTWIILLITLTKILWGKYYYFPILEMRKLRQTEVTSKQKGSPFCHRSSTPTPLPQVIRERSMSQTSKPLQVQSFVAFWYAWVLISLARVGLFNHKGYIPLDSGSPSYQVLWQDPQN